MGEGEVLLRDGFRRAVTGAESLGFECPIQNPQCAHVLSKAQFLAWNILGPVFRGAAWTTAVRTTAFEALVCVVHEGDDAGNCA